MSTDKKTKGSMTVEAVFITPIIIVVVLFLLYMILYCTDKVRMQSFLFYEILEYQDLEEQESMQQSKKMEMNIQNVDNYLNSKFSGGILVKEISDISSEQTITKKIYHLKLKAMPLYPLIRKFSCDNDTDMELSVCYDTRNASDILRMFQALAVKEDKND